MTNDSITDEIRAIRRELAAQFGNDVSRILADARQREAADGRAYVTLPKRNGSAAVVEHLGQTAPSLPRSVK
jgi:hypothetical protein